MVLAKETRKISSVPEVCIVCVYCVYIVCIMCSCNMHSISHNNNNNKQDGGLFWHAWANVVEQLTFHKQGLVEGEKS